MNAKRLLQVSIVLIMLLSIVFPEAVKAETPQVLFVKPDGLTSGVCDSWANACDLQYVVTNWEFGWDREIWVAAGVYRGTVNLNFREAMYGGFAGTESSRDERNWQKNLTILSGDIDNNDINIDGNFIAETTADIQGENAEHVVFINIGGSGLLDGFIITAGQGGQGGGGGIFNPFGDNAVLTNLIISGNRSGMFNYSGDPVLTNVTFSGNKAGAGGGMYNYRYSYPTLINVIFSGNEAGWGGGMYNSGASNPTLKNVIFAGNKADLGGGMYNDWAASPTLMNVIFTGNEANYGGGMYSIASFNPELVHPLLINSIMWGDHAFYADPEIHNENNAMVTVTYSDVQGDWSGTGNIDADPLFVDPADGDLHLQAGSPAIDSGTNDRCPSTDFDNVSRPQDGNHDGTAICDMGAFEFFGITATVDIEPNTLNLKSNGKWITAYIELPNGFGVENIDTSTLMLEGTIPVEPRPITVSDYDNNEVPDLMVKFSHPALIKYLNGMTGEVTLLVNGKLTDGTPLEGRDNITVINPGKK